MVKQIGTLKTKLEINTKLLLLQIKTKILNKYAELWDEIKYQIETINGSKPGRYRKDFMRIKFNSNDNLPLKIKAL